MNRKFAASIARSRRDGDLVWVHDYHLLLVAKELQALGADERAGFFLHIPFPPPEVLSRLPWHQELLAAMLRFDLLGFQTEADCRNFVRCVESLEAPLTGSDEASPSSPLPASAAPRSGVFPISVDAGALAEAAGRQAVHARVLELRREFSGLKILLGVDRLDYTKGITQKLRGSVALIQLVVPSRESIVDYRELRREVERLVREINAAFGRPGWRPVHYLYARWERGELLAHYRVADVALVTPLRDGMNLVAKEFCAANVEGTGVLVLSAFAGAACQLRDALLVNPYHTDELAAAIHRACTMPLEERRRRMTALRRAVRTQDVYAWTARFLRAAFSSPPSPGAAARSTPTSGASPWSDALVR